MVEIKAFPSLAGSSKQADHDLGQCRLIYSKSKVYVNPTAYARDNIPGFVVLVKKVGIYFVGFVMDLDRGVPGRSQSKLFVGLDTRNAPE